MIFEPLTRAFDGYIFDLDGTLADSMGVSHGAWLAALRSQGATFDFGWDLFTSRAGMSLHKTVEALNEQFGLQMDPDAVAARQRLEYERILPRVQPVGEVVALARSVAGSAKLSVASGGERAVVLRTLEVIGVADIISVVITPADVVRGKPAPDMFLLAAERMGVEPTSCVVFEDSDFGIQAAQEAGMAWVRVYPPNRRDL